jgi:acetyltransferase-like isoleucine patch superfamily enzyme
MWRLMAATPKIHPLIHVIRQIERARGTVHLPTGRWLGGALFYARPLLFNVRTLLMQILVYEPALRYRCRTVGRKLKLHGPAPRISGDGIIDIGDHVEFVEGMSLVVGMGLPDPAHLELKNHITFGGHHVICVARKVSIGNHCWIGAGTKIYDNDVHSMQAIERRVQFGNMLTVRSAPIVIEDDVWLGINTLILKGVTLHRGAVVGAGAVVTDSVPPYCVVVGNPARIVERMSPDASTDERVSALGTH